MNALLQLPMLAIAASCSPARDDEDNRWSETFAGEIVAMNGQPIDTGFRITFYSTDGDEIPERYSIESGCIDRGYFDPKHMRFLSGTSPQSTGADRVSSKMREEVAKRPLRACRADHPAVYQRLLLLMQEGAVLETKDGDARLVSPSEQTIEAIADPFVVIG